MAGNMLHPSLMPAALAGLMPISSGGPISVLNIPHQQRNPATVLFQHQDVGFIRMDTQQQQQQQLSNASPTGSVSSSTSPSVETSPEESAELIKELQKERESLESIPSENKQHTIKLIDQEIYRLQSGCKGSGLKDSIKYVDVYRERPIRLTVRVLVPVREHPKFNFVGKLLGPKGNSMKRLQEETMTKMAVLGRGSMRDKQKEEELRASSDPKYQHLNEELHVEITAFAPPAEAHARIAYALTEVRKYLIPDSNDEIRQEQMREMEILSANGGDSISIAAAAAAAAAAATSDPKRQQQLGQSLALAAALRPQQQQQALTRSAVLRNTTPLTPLITTGIRNPLTPAAAAAAGAAFPPIVHKIVSSSSSSSSSSSNSSNNSSSSAKVHGLLVSEGTEYLHLDSSQRDEGILSATTEDANGITINGLKAPGMFHDNRIKLRQNIAPY